MSLQRYLRALARYWYIPAAFVLAGALGTWIYLKFNLGQKAVVTVAVLEPSITNNLNGGQAQVNFGSIAESRAVAERVVRELSLDMEPEALQANINVELARTLIPSVASPLYTVQIENPDGKLALRIAQAVVGQSRAVFQQLNAPDLGALEVMLAPQETELREQLTLAHGDLRDFEETSRAWLLPLQIEHQMHLIQALRESSGLALATDEVEQELETTLSQAQTELDALYTLLPEYERLSLDATVAIDRMLILSDAKTLRISPQAVKRLEPNRRLARRLARGPNGPLNFTAEDVGVGNRRPRPSPKMPMIVGQRPGPPSSGPSPLTRYGARARKPSSQGRTRAWTRSACSISRNGWRTSRRSSRRYSTCCWPTAYRVWVMKRLSPWRRPNSSGS
jgi:hypothetical protein